MKTWFATVAVAATVMLAGAAQAATVSAAFARVGNDGVFTLTAEQQAYLGTSATRIGFLRGRAADGNTIAAGTTFTAATVAGRCTRGCSAVQGFLNGGATGVTYDGAYLDALGTTRIDAETPQAVSLVAFLFGGTANITFAGTAGGTQTFNAGQTRGALAFEVPQPAPVPLPAAGWMLLAGIGGLVAAGRRRRAAAA